MANDVVRPLSFTTPVVSSSTDRYTQVPEVGTLVYDSVLGKLVVCVSSVVGSAAWEAVTSVAE